MKHSSASGMGGAAVSPAAQIFMRCKIGLLAVWLLPRLDSAASLIWKICPSVGGFFAHLLKGDVPAFCCSGAHVLIIIRL